ncbi:RNA polymerase sigma-28 factor [bioreactor metagenome]|uniref:RNA polymerase sigma-28 factor n=1 Tax=bioreactor metagenome TaxID=1076179 RepID=A0A644ZCS8_9ZZZZ
MFVTGAAILVNCMFFLLFLTTPTSFPRPLPPEEEARLLALVAEGDRAARCKLIEHNLRLVAHIVKKYYTAGEQDDLISIGTIGLIKAIDSFDSHKGIRLATYAARCVENEILMYFRQLKKSSSDISLSEALDSDKDGNTLSLYDVLCSEDSIIDEVDKKISIERMGHLLGSALDPREREIIIRRYGLCGKPEQTQREVAAALGISRSYVSHRHKCKRGPCNYR